MTVLARITLLLGLASWVWMAEKPQVTATCAPVAVVIPGGQTQVLVSLAIPAGWHLYWQNPGDNGMPPKLTWKLPAGWTAGAPQFPVPKRHAEAGMVDFIFEDHLDLLVRLQAPADAPPGAVPVEAQIGYLVCRESCVPGRTTVATQVTVLGLGETATQPWRQPAGFPQALPVPGLTLVARRQGDGIDLDVIGDLPEPPEFPFFPLAEGVFDLTAPQILDKKPDRWRLHLKLVANAAAPSAVQGVLTGIPTVAGITLDLPLTP